MVTDAINSYKEYANKIGDRKSLYQTVAKEYGVQCALYPGSHIDIAPSLVIPQVTYIDNFKGAISFFKHPESIQDYIEQNKEYSAPCTFAFIAQDYTLPFEIKDVDLIISQYAGFVGQATKSHLKKGGILLCNDSHGDATLAMLDEDFAFIGVIGPNNKITTDQLDEYFKLRKDKGIDKGAVLKSMRGPKYILTSENYIFQKIS